MKRLLLIIILLIPAYGICQYSGTWFRATQYMNSPLYKINGVSITPKLYYQKSIDTVKTSLTGLVKVTSGVLSSITDNSSSWNTAYGWGNHALAGYFVGTSSTVRGLFSSTATGLTYTNSTGVLSLTSGYSIPTTTQESSWTSKEPALGNPKNNGEVISSTTGGTRSWVAKENALGNPETNGYVLSSTTSGTRSWVANNPSQWTTGSYSIYYNGIFPIAIGQDAEQIASNAYLYVGGGERTYNENRIGINCSLNIAANEEDNDYTAIGISSTPTVADGYRFKKAIGLYSAPDGGITNYSAILLGGNVGVNTETPLYKMDVNGSINGTSYYLNSVSLTPKLFYQKSIDTLNKGIYYSDTYKKAVMIDTLTGRLYKRNIEKAVFANMYIADNSTAITVPSGTSWTKVTGVSAGEYSGMSVSAVNSKITTSKAGRYEITLSMTSKTNTANTSLETCIYVDGARVPRLSIVRELINANKYTPGSVSSIVSIAAGKDIEVYTRHDNASSVQVTVYTGNINVKYLGE